MLSLRLQHGCPGTVPLQPGLYAAGLGIAGFLLTVIFFFVLCVASLAHINDPRSWSIAARPHSWCDSTRPDPTHARTHAHAGCNACNVTQRMQRNVRARTHTHRCDLLNVMTAYPLIFWTIMLNGRIGATSHPLHGVDSACVAGLPSTGAQQTERSWKAALRVHSACRGARMGRVQGRAHGRSQTAVD